MVRLVQGSDKMTNTHTIVDDGNQTGAGLVTHMRVHYVGSNINGTRVVRAVFL